MLTRFSLKWYLGKGNGFHFCEVRLLEKLGFARVNSVWVAGARRMGGAWVEGHRWENRWWIDGRCALPHS